MIAAIKDVKNTELLIAGYIMSETLSRQILTTPNVINEGILKPCRSIRTSIAFKCHDSAIRSRGSAY